MAGEPDALPCSHGQLRVALLADEVLSLEGQMYYLDPKAPGQVVGAIHRDLNMKRFNAAVTTYLSNIV